MTLQPYGVQRLEALHAIAEIPQFGHVVMAASTKYRSTVTHQCRKPRMP
ncbi:hypothetical protein [Nitrobacter winogradskyi]|uniref:Uncharacterized protein n=1 Tax=Nitrobacter winogradskyi TaxID=913 RepID=A0ACC6ANR3_NITWI|nr:hypothetical protein [Nitrobacter winogradskyi]MCP2001319.1 hypothetical protein [Nitrobacter winogradskyi]